MVAASPLAGEYSRFTTTTNSWSERQSSSAPGRWYVWLDSQTKAIYEGEGPPILTTSTTFEPDGFGLGNVRDEMVHVYRGNSTGPEIESRHTVTLWDPGSGDWTMGVPIRRTVTSTRGGLSETRTTAYRYYPNKLLHFVDREPDSTDPNVRLTTTYDRDVAWNVSDVILDANGVTRTAHISYDSQGLFPMFYRDNLGHTTEVQYDTTNGQLVTAMDPNGRITQRRFNPFGRLEVETSPTEEVDVSYLAASPEDGVPYVGRTWGAIKRHATSTAHGLVDTTFDAYGRVVSTRASGLDGSVIRTDIARDGAGRVVTAAAPRKEGGALQGSMSYEYDALSRVRRAIWPDGRSTEYWYASSPNAAPEGAALLQRGLADAIWLTAREDRNGLYTVTGVDHYQVPAYVWQVEDPAILGDPDLLGMSPGSVYGRGPFDELRSVDDPVDTTEISYDVIGRKLGVSSQTTGDDTYQYDTFDEVTSHSDGAGLRSCFFHDPLGRVLEVRKGSATDCPASGRSRRKLRLRWQPRRQHRVRGRTRQWNQRRDRTADRQLPRGEPRECRRNWNDPELLLRDPPRG